MANVIKTTLKLKRGLLMRWEMTNPILAAGEPGWASDVGILKIGDGEHSWTELPALMGVDLNEEDIQIELLQAKVEELAKEIRNNGLNTTTNKPSSNKKPASVSQVRDSKE